MAFSFGFDALKSGFFDAAALQKEVAREERKRMSRFGAYARRRIKSSLKYATGKSAPGRPPHVHTASGFSRKKGADGKRQPVSPLRELQFFAYDPATKSVVVGPLKFGGNGGIAPGLLERGGPGVFKDSRTGELKRGVWAPRPSVGPAGDAEAASGKFLVG